MKAYIVKDEESCENWTTVVFAETRGEAKTLAMATDACEDARYIDIRASRIPELDEHYRGRVEMDWEDAQDRIALVKLGWSCNPEYWDPSDCELCPATDWCDLYKDSKR